MKLATALGIVFLASSVHAQTIIHFEDGSTYTLQGRERVYISNKDNIYSATGNVETAVRFFKQKPWAKRDYQPEPTTGDELCWEWGGIAPPPGYSVEACYVQEEEPTKPADPCPGGLSFGGQCSN